MVEFMTTFSKERIRQIADEVTRRAKARKDYLVDRAKMSTMVADGSLHLGMPDENSESTLFDFRRSARNQMLGTLDIPVKFADRLADRGHIDLLSNTINELLTRESVKEFRKRDVRYRHLVRTLDGKVDAILSDSYRCLDNYDLFTIVLQQFKQMEAKGLPRPEIWDLRLTDDEFRLCAVAPHISGKVTTDRTFDPGDGWKSRWYGEEGDVLNAALTISNSETGRGSLHARPAILRRVCENYCVWQDGVTQVHLGKRNEEEGRVFFSEETKRQEDKVIWMKVNDLISNTFDPSEFQKRIDLINATTKVQVESATQAVEAAVRVFGLPEEHREAILEEFLGTGDKTQYGLCQALTAQVNPKARQGRKLDEETLNSYEDAGGKVLGMSEREFDSFLATVAK